LYSGKQKRVDVGKLRKKIQAGSQKVSKIAETKNPEKKNTKSEHGVQAD